MDDASEGPSSPVANGAASPRENGLDKTVVSASLGAGVQTLKKDAPPHSPRSGTSSNASTPSAKKMEEREKPTTPISKSLTPTSGAAMIGAGLKSSANKLMQGPPMPGVPSALSAVSAYSPHYPPPLPPPPPHLAPAGQHPHVDAMGYNGYAAPRAPGSLQQFYDPHVAMRASMGSIGIPGGKP